MHRIKLQKNIFRKNNIVSMLFSIPVFLTIIGIFFVFEASSVSAFRNMGSSFYFAKLQLMWFAIGFVVMIFFALFDYKKLYYVSFPILVSAIFFLVLVLIPGFNNTVMGARRWINLGAFRFQPTEYAKIAVILYLSSWFMQKSHKRIIPFLILLSILVGLIMIQPDLGTTLIISSLAVLIYFVSGEPIRYLLMLIPVAMGVFLFLIKTSTYRAKRLLSFLNPTIDPLGINYHVNQILISLSAGGLFGRGFSESRQKYQFLPEAHTDSIFAIIGEEIGFIGGIGIIFMYVMLLYVIYKVIVMCDDRFGKLIASSVLCLIAIHVILNLGGMVNLIPLTGVPLPFLSYGGSSLLVFYSLLGIIINIARHS